MKINRNIFLKPKIKNEYGELIEEIRDTKKMLLNIEKCFSDVSDNNLIDACIYQRESLCARYRYLLSKAKVNSVTNQPFPNEF